MNRTTLMFENRYRCRDGSYRWLTWNAVPIPDEGLVFYEGLEADNTKTYWMRHKSVYEQQVRAPLQALLDGLGPA